MKDFLSPLELAIKFEIEGKEYFLNAVDKVTHPFGKKMFQELAENEDRHITKICRIKEALQKTNSWSDDVSVIGEGESLTTIFKTAQNEIDKNICVPESDLEVLDQALELESKGQEFYTDLAEKSENRKAKKFYEILADEEKEHYSLLQDTKEYLILGKIVDCEFE